MRRFYFKLLLAGLFFVNGLGEVLAAKLPKTQSRAALHDSTRLRLCLVSVRDYFKKQQFDSLLIALKTAFELSKKLPTTRFNAELYLYYAYWYRSQKQVDQSLKMYELALAFGKKNAQPAIIERAGYGLAVAYTDLAYRTGSVEAHRHCIKQIFENITLTNQKELPGTYLHYNYSLLASIYRENGNDSLAFFYLEKQQPFLKKLKDPASQLWFLANAIEINLHKKNLQAAQLSLNQLLQFTSQGTDTYTYVLLDVITQFVHFGKFDEALSLIKVMRNTPKFVKGSDPPSELLLHTHLATIYLAKKQYSLAQQAYNQAVIFFKKDAISFGNQLKLLVIQQALLENEKQFKEALALLKVIHQMKDSLLFNQYNSKIVSTQESLKQEEKQTALKQQLKVEKLKQQLKTEALENMQLRQRNYLLIIGFTLGILILLGYQFYQVKKKTAMIEQINEKLYQLMSIIGHDLRSPITSLLGKLSQMAETNEFIKDHIPAVNNLLLTTDNLLYWAYNQKDDSLKLYPQVVALQEIIDEVLDLYGISVEMAQVNIQNEVNPQVMVKADENHLRIIFRNLIQNALRYTSPGGQIYLRTQLLSDSNNLIIENTSRGTERNRAFQQKQGLGLGLKLVSELTKINQGNFVFYQGKESFTVVLKFAKVA